MATTRTSQDRNRPSSRLDSEGEEDDDDADKVQIANTILLQWTGLTLPANTVHVVCMFSVLII